jgi:hypothetical protein
MKTRMENALWLTDRFSEPELAAMSEHEVKEIYDRLGKAARHSPVLRPVLGLDGPPAMSPEQVFAIWERLTADDIAFVQHCLEQSPGLTLAECLQELKDLGGL